MLVETLKWRREFEVDSVMEEKFPEDAFGKLSYVFGHDKKGRPIQYVVFSIFRVSFSSVIIFITPATTITWITSTLKLHSAI